MTHRDMLVVFRDAAPCSAFAAHGSCLHVSDGAVCQPQEFIDER
jgi:hypothetical protein